MAWLERGVLAVSLLTGVAHADAPNYGKVETFQPGKKYNCVPTADHKAWDCSESGQAAARRDDLAHDIAPAAAAAPAPAPKSSELPAYLTNPAAGRRQSAPAAAPTKPVVAEPAAVPAPQPAPAPAPASAPKPASVAAPAPAAAPEPESATAPAARPTSPPVVETPSAPSAHTTEPAPAPATAVEAPRSAPVATMGTLGNREFLTLPASSYIVEIAHSANRAEIAALHANLHLPLGELYELHLTRDGGDWWLLVWGHFGDIESARAARSDLPPDAAVNAGWPRRIAPLQAEARKSTE